MNGIHNYQKDVAAISQIPSIDSLLDVLCRTSGMGFAGIARVTKDKWITCGVRDQINFGIKPGDELNVETTICNEVRLSEKLVVIDNVEHDIHYCDHPTPTLYGFQSYISVPIVKKNGEFFGTLCAVDKLPHHLSSIEIVGMFHLFAELISLHLDALDTAQASESKLFADTEIIEALEIKVAKRTRELEEKNTALEEMNDNLKFFAHMSSHDLQEPLRKINIFSKMIFEQESGKISRMSKEYFERMQGAAQRMQTLIEKLLNYSQVTAADIPFEMTDLNGLIEEVKVSLKEELQHSNATIAVSSMCSAPIIPFQMQQVFYNLVSNSLKFSIPDRPPKITVSSEIAKGVFF